MAILFTVFLALLALTCPIGIAQGIACIAVSKTVGVISVTTLTKAIVSGFSSFTLVAIPLFTFAGDIMGQGGISSRLIGVAKLGLGKITGGLGIVSIVACMIFAAISGTGSATVAAIGLIMIPEMVRGGYDKPYATSLVATAGTIGTIISRSICMVVYAVAAQTSIAAMFTSGFPVGILVGTSLCLYAFISSKRKGYQPIELHYTTKEVIHTLIDSIPSFLVPVLVLGSIYGGICTPTEAAAIGCLLGVIISVFIYKEVKLSEVPYLLFRSVALGAPVFLIIGISTAFGRILAIT